jgi:sugar lactone lactonase YvrE
VLRRIIILAVFIYCQLLGSICYAQNIINTIAGKGIAGYSGDDSLAINAKLKAPARICADKFGNIFIADAGNARIRKINASTGIITTVAGSGNWGYSGDGGLATVADLNCPQAVFVDTANNIYIADGCNHRVRKVLASTGIITTIAGNGSPGNIGDGTIATSAQLNQPSGLYVDNQGNVFIADWANNKIRKVDAVTGTIATIAGTGVAGYLGDGGLATNAQVHGAIDVYGDSHGNIFVSDKSNNVVRKVDVSSGIITTVVGTGAAGYSGDGGLAVHASLNSPSGISIDNSDNIYISDYENGVIRKFSSSSGNISTVAGNGTVGFSGDGGPATNAQLFASHVLIGKDGNMLIADYQNNRIRKVQYNLGVKDLAEDKLKIYPNPSSGIFTIETGKPNQYSLTISNLLGQQVYQAAITNPSTIVDLSKEAAGVYIIQVQGGLKTWVEKVILSH